MNALRKGRFLMIGDGRNRRTLVHSKDVCKAAVLAAEKACALGQVFNVTDGHVHTLQDIIKAMCTALGQRAPRFHLPVSLARFTADLIETGMKVVGRNPPIRRAMVDKIIQDIAVSGDKIQRQLGYKAEHSLVRGWRETIDMGKG
jgi:UDP-glucose 4-epimerase